mmetsp:Transcript_60548/g.100613  ORF Transcript_60548/g.100613 Transcript_60548/m.100613 type:complete len:135 (+) Transcript_60548:401-805(+)
MAKPPRRVCNVSVIFKPQLGLVFCSTLLKSKEDFVEIEPAHVLSRTMLSTGWVYFSKFWNSGISVSRKDERLLSQTLLPCLTAAFKVFGTSSLLSATKKDTAEAEYDMIMTKPTSVHDAATILPDRVPGLSSAT